MILAQGLGLHFHRSAGNPFVLAYISRVQGDGGTVEGVTCLENEVTRLTAIEVLFLDQVQAFETRVTGDSGTFESIFCTRQEVINLGSVNI